jgi:ABC-type uncharacterized transport system involved in gliding motility auxiliary subunit
MNLNTRRQLLVDVILEVPIFVTQVELKLTYKKAFIINAMPKRLLRSFSSRLY